MNHNSEAPDRREGLLSVHLETGASLPSTSSLSSSSSSSFPSREDNNSSPMASKHDGQDVQQAEGGSGKDWSVAIGCTIHRRSGNCNNRKSAVDDSERVEEKSDTLCLDDGRRRDHKSPHRSQRSRTDSADSDHNSATCHNLRGPGDFIATQLAKINLSYNEFTGPRVKSYDAHKLADFRYV